METKYEELLALISEQLTEKNQEELIEKLKEEINKF
jgi:hypothetical protein